MLLLWQAAKNWTGSLTTRAASLQAGWAGGFDAQTQWPATACMAALSTTQQETASCWLSMHMASLAGSSAIKIQDSRGGAATRPHILTFTTWGLATAWTHCLALGTGLTWH